MPDDPFGKAERSTKEKAAIGAAGVGGVAAVGAAGQLKVPEHSHFSRETRKKIAGLPAGVHEINTSELGKNPRKLGARKQQTAYVATMAKERPEPYSPVPVTRYKDGVIQRDNAHSVMANAMKGKKTTIKIEDAPGYRPSRRLGEEVVRRGQSKFQQRRLRRNTNIGEAGIGQRAAKYKASSRAANTAKRPHGVVEEGFKLSKKPYGIARALGIAKKDDTHLNGVTAGATGAAGVGALASTPVRRAGKKVSVAGDKMSSSDAKTVLSPGYRPGNKRSIKRMASNLGSLENKPTTAIKYKDGTVNIWDGNHRGTARVARGDSSIPLKVIQGGERPTVSATRDVYHRGAQKMHARRMDRGDFKPGRSTPKHAKEGKIYGAIANGSPKRAGRSGPVTMETIRTATGPTKTALRLRQGAHIAGGAALLGTAGALLRDKDKVKKMDVFKKQDDTELNISKAGFDLNREYGFTGKDSRKSVQRDLARRGSPFRGPNKKQNNAIIGSSATAGAAITGGALLHASRDKRVGALAAGAGAAYGGLLGRAVTEQKHTGPAMQHGLEQGHLRATKKGEKVSAWSGQIKQKKVKKSDTTSAFGVEH